MNDNGHQAQTQAEQQHMLRRAEELTRAHDQLHVPDAPDDLPDVSDHLDELARLVQDLSARIRGHAEPGQDAEEPELHEDAAFYWSWAAKRLAHATGLYAAACHNITLIRRSARRHGEHPAHAFIRRGAFAESQQHLTHTRDGLISARAALEIGAERLGESDSRLQAARSRSPHVHGDPAADGSGPVIGSLCSGYGGLDLGVQAALGGTLAWHAEVDPGASRILARHWPGTPNLGDITTVNWADVPEVCGSVTEGGSRSEVTVGVTC
ncbi:hypothetical protein [Streptomyces sp. NPDC048172]|uniref:hypothetical protein n=1 Tax=Streptomyces sp. NPDC048172 TaxID=3365505 RepID=UPI00371E8946